MAKPSSESRTIPAYNGKHPRNIPSLTSLYSPKLCVYLLTIFTILFTLFHIQALQTPPSSPWDFTHQQRKPVSNDTETSPQVPQDYNCGEELKSMVSKLKEAVTFLPLKDLRYSSKALVGHTWFMSSMLDTQEKGEVQYQEFPSLASKGRILCLKGCHTHDGSRNSYALAWPDSLPPNATLMKGLTFISYNHYNYDNIWHGLSSMVPFVAWHVKNRCSNPPTRWILYHWGELRTKMGPWLSSLMKATFGEPLNIEIFRKIDDENNTSPTCFAKSVVMRHNEGGMSRENRLKVYDLLRCKARLSCNVTIISKVNETGDPIIGMTLFMRTGPRSFKNETAVIGIFHKACRNVTGCRLRVAYANNLSFCEQVKLMSLTDILVSPHGAQLTNMFLMDRNSSVMEFFPKGWLKLAGIGQYVYHWIASWSGMNHRGAWRDPGRERCPFAEDDRRCMSVYKNARIGHDEKYFSEWARNVLSEVKLRKLDDVFKKSGSSVSGSCAC